MDSALTLREKNPPGHRRIIIVIKRRREKASRRRYLFKRSRTGSGSRPAAEEPAGRRPPGVRAGQRQGTAGAPGPPEAAPQGARPAAHSPGSRGGVCLHRGNAPSHPRPSRARTTPRGPAPRPRPGSRSAPRAPVPVRSLRPPQVLRARRAPRADPAPVRSACFQQPSGRKGLRGWPRGQPPRALPPTPRKGRRQMPGGRDYGTGAHDAGTVGKLIKITSPRALGSEGGKCPDVVSGGAGVERHPALCRRQDSGGRCLWPPFPANFSDACSSGSDTGEAVEVGFSFLGRTGHGGELPPPPGGSLLPQVRAARQRRGELGPRGGGGREGAARRNAMARGSFGNENQTGRLFTHRRSP